MKYFFILGNNPTLSIAEIYSVFKNQGVLSIHDQAAAFLETDQDLAPEDTIKKLGGTIKYGLLCGHSKFNTRELIDKIEKKLKPESGKFKFGLSYYGQKKLDLRIIGMTVKTNLKNNGHSVRFVTSREKTLSSVVVEQNKLASKGQEIILLENNNELLIGQTRAVQPFKELSFRDYGRPARDDHSGLLPPKLAQIMINLSGANIDKTILDPFCGSGTILSEAVYMGYQNIIGSDNSAKAVLDSKKNIQWTAEKYQIKNYKLQIIESDATRLSRTIANNSIDAIITEPYLGPQRGKIEIKKIIPELEKLYTQALADFKKILKPGAKAVMIWPIFHAANSLHQIMPNTNGFKIINPLPPALAENKNIKLTNRGTIIYGRENQRVWREIVILEKSK